MSLKITDQLFTGPFDLAKARRRSNHPAVVYAVISRGGEPWDPVFQLIDIGDTSGRDTDFVELAVSADWASHAASDLQIYFLDTLPDGENTLEMRTDIISRIREKLNPPHGTISMAAGM